MDRVTRARIQNLLHEVRRLPSRGRWCVGELARRYSLDPMIVRGLLESDGIDTDVEPEPEPDPNETTQMMRFDELDRSSSDSL